MSLTSITERLFKAEFLLFLWIGTVVITVIIKWKLENTFVILSVIWLGLFFYSAIYYLVKSAIGRRILVIMACLTMAGYFLFMYMFNSIGLSELKLGGNNHGSKMTDLIDGYFEAFPSIGDYYVVRREYESIDSKDPHMYDKEGRRTLFFRKQKMSKQQVSKEIQIRFLYYDKTGNIERTYNAVCHRQDFENCTPILIDAEILNHPEIFKTVIKVLQHPCDTKKGFLTSYANPPQFRYKDDCKQPQDAFGKIIIGLVDNKNKLVSVVTIVRPNMYGGML